MTTCKMKIQKVQKLELNIKMNHLHQPESINALTGLQTQRVDIKGRIAISVLLTVYGTLQMNAFLSYSIHLN